MSYSFAALYISGIVGMIIGFVIGLICNGDVKKLNETINEKETAVRTWIGWYDLVWEENLKAKAEIDRLSDLVATLQAKVPARNARGKFVAR